MKLARIQSGLIALATIAAFIFISVRSTGPARAKESSSSSSIIEGRVVLVGNPVADASVTLYAAGEGAPTEVARSKTDAGGRFRLDTTSAPKDSVLYVVAKGPNQAVALMTLWGTSFPNTITVNELTTVASTFTAARFINGEAICANRLGLRIAAGNTPNLVDPQTGGWGKVIVDPGNSTWTTALANLNTLGSLISAFATVADDDWRTRFLRAATPIGGASPKNTLDAMAAIARTPWANPKVLYALFDEAYPQPKDGARRKAPFAPYLAYAPPDFILSLWFGGGGSYSNGNMVFDSDGNMWCGQNWLD